MDFLNNIIELEESLTYLENLRKILGFDVSIDEDNKIQIFGDDVIYFKYLEKCEIKTDAHKKLDEYLRDDLKMTYLRITKHNQNHVRDLLNMSDKKYRYNELEEAIYSIPESTIYLVFKTCVENVKASRKFFVIKKNLKTGRTHLIETSFFDWIDIDYLRKLYLYA